MAPVTSDWAWRVLKFELVVVPAVLFGTLLLERTVSRGGSDASDQ
jgi:hypothetical protein